MYTIRFLRCFSPVRVARAAALVLIAFLMAGVVRDCAALYRSERLWAGQKAYGALRFGIDPVSVPFSFYDGSGWNGLDADVARQLCNRLGFRLESDPVGYDALYDSLFVGRADAGMSALVRDETRTNDALFTRGYFEAGLTAITVASAATPTTLEGLANMRLAAAFGSDADHAVRRLQRTSPGTIRINLASAEAAVQLLRAGSADVALVDGVEARRIATIDLRTIVLRSDPYVLAVRPDQYRLHYELNRVLDALKADGSLDTIVSQWLHP